MNLLQKQQKFSELVGALLLRAGVLGYKITLGEALRPEAMAEIYMEEGKGILHSLHTVKLAIDLNFFKDDVYLTGVKDLEPIGEWWELQSGDDYTCCWGGRFESLDANHFSISHNSVK